MDDNAVPAAQHFSPDDWADEYRPDALLGLPAVRSMIEACGRDPQVTMSADEFLAGAAAALPFKHMEKLALRSFARGRERTLRWGVKTGKEADAQFPAPIGHVIVAVLCSMARFGQTVRSVDQYDDGCVLTADIPSSKKVFGGVLRVEIRRDKAGAGATTSVAADARIPGQVYDWGVGKKTLATLMADIPALVPVRPS